MTPEAIERELEIQGKHVMARATTFESWPQYRQHHVASLDQFNSDQLEKLRQLFEKHHSLVGFAAG